MEYRYTAIVLGKRETGETDRLYTLYTREAGKITTMAKGVRKPTAKLASQLENGSQVGVTVIRGRGIGKIAGAIAEERFSSLRSDYEVYQLILTTLDRVRTLTEPEESDFEVYDLLQQFLHLSEELLKNEKRAQFFFLRECFLLQLYSLLGYHIDTHHCIATGEKLTRGQRYMFSPRDGACILAQEAHKYPQAVPVSEDAIVLLRLILTNTLASLLKLVDAHKETKTLGRIAEALYRWTIRH
jgi:DNA repair protein RecO (recombination protein O)